ncbi:NUDIX hydrolase [Candidatus Bathyarchaeota archaeon]|nr:NUDIX hydrolase [Candidatus Bathyarchaeota archaeon]
MNKIYPNQPIIGVGAVIIRNGKLLLEQRKANPGRGKWSVPGGVVELGESSKQTVIREVKEETNLIVEEPTLIDVVNYIVLDEKRKVKYHFLIVEYFMKLKGGTLKAADDAAELRWVSFDEVKNYDLIKSFREFFQKNLQVLEKLDSSSVLM